MSLREFVGDAYYLWARAEYDASRVFLKNCGKGVDKDIIGMHKLTCTVFRRYAIN